MTEEKAKPTSILMDYLLAVYKDDPFVGAELFRLNSPKKPEEIAKNPKKS